MIWIPFELHTHTVHSDGRHTLLEMCREARKLGLGGIALTDHNTVSGLAEAEEAMAETGVAVVPGMEWTTFYGHMLTLGAPYCEWRDLGPGDIHKGIERVHQAGGIVGIAHPYSYGSPICTGCHWEYEIMDWQQIDYMEVWHELMPPYKSHNLPALQQWTDLLNEGFRITATSGRDWHHSDSDELPAFTYVGFNEAHERYSVEKVVESIRCGRCIVSMGPLLHVEARVDDVSYGIGDIVGVAGAAADTVELRLSVEPGALPDRTRDLVKITKLIVESNLGEQVELPWNNNDSHVISLPRVQSQALLWLRVKAVGMLNGGLTTVAFTNPIYFL